MAATIIFLGFFITAVVTGINSNAMIVAHNVTVTAICTTNGDRPPDWFVNGMVVLSSGYRYRSSTRNGVEKIATLIIDGNRISDTLNIHCEVYDMTERQFLPMHSNTLTIQGHLPSPESIYINEVVNYSVIEWKPPYSSFNNKSDVMHLDPHITHYTVYITDIYTNNIIEQINVTETQFNFDTSDLDLCLMYQISAWNAGGESELSEPVQTRVPQVPHSIAVENISVVVTAVSNIFNIYTGVNTVCTSRIPEFFLITLMNSTRSVLKESNISHDPGQAAANFTISLPQNVDVCSLHLRISAGNSAGVSAPGKTVEVGVSTAAPTVVTTTVSTGSDTIIYVDDHQQGDSTTLIVIIIGVIAAVGGVLIVAATVGIIKYSKDKLKKCDIEMKPNQAYETVSLPTPSMPATHVHTEPCPAYEVVVQAQSTLRVK